VSHKVSLATHGLLDPFCPVVHGIKIMKHDSLVPNKNSFWWQYNHYHVPITDTLFLPVGLLPVQQTLAPMSTDWTAAERPTD